jgi:pimeloyl-ACP methyl ester carboxylesterase
LAVLVLSACQPPTSPSPAPLRTTYRVIGGISMGGIGAASLGLAFPDRFDAVVTLGGPLDYAFFSRSLDSALTQGFCSREEIEAILRQDPKRLNDPSAFATCAQRMPTLPFEHRQDFNHWHVTLSGGTFNRDRYLELMTDLSLAYGNFFSFNEKAPEAPAGVSPTAIRAFASDFCIKPIRVSRLFNAEYNPQGTYDAISFCDGEPETYVCRATGERVDFCADPVNIEKPLAVAREASFADAFCAAKGGALRATKESDEGKLAFLNFGGFRDPCREATQPQGVMLAYDYNGNGRRDFGEPIVNNGRERFDDIGQDGCPDAFEDGQGGCRATPREPAGDFNRDNYDVEENPTGTQGNWVFDDGEPFRDFGLDGVGGTDDFGEGNGRFDESIGRQTLKRYDGRSNYRKLSLSQQRRLTVLADGGIRDIFNLGLMAQHLFSAVRATLGPLAVGEYRDFAQIPGLTNRQGRFDPWTKAWSRLPRNMLTLFGNGIPTDAERLAGEGDHVGTTEQALHRFSLVFNFVASRWPALERPSTPTTLNGVQKSVVFPSSVLNAQWEYAISLPPGYDDAENANVRYPVAYLLHGYGMEPTGFVSTALVADTQVVNPEVALRPVIYVFPYGRCCFVSVSGSKECRERDDDGTLFRNKAGWRRECVSGSFWVNRTALTSDDSTRYGDALFELMEHIDATYRTLLPTHGADTE